MSRESQKRRKKVSSYSGFTVQSADQQIEVLKGKISAEEFFNSFIKQRKPVKLDKTLNDFLDTKPLEIENIEASLDCQDPLQVERKHQDGFGSGVKRVKMTFAEFVNRIQNGESDYYLTTQYDFDDPKGDGTDSVVQCDEEGGKDSVDVVADVYGNEEKDYDDDDGQDDAGEEDEAKVEAQLGFPDFDQLSQASSIDSFDANNLHDDFDDLESLDGEIVDTDLNITASEASVRVRELFQAPLTKMYHRIPVLPEFFKTLVPQQINLWMGCTSTKEPVKSIDVQAGLGKAIPGSGMSSGLHHDHADNLYVLISGCKRFTLFSPADAEKLFTVGSIFRIYSNGLIDYTQDEKAPSWKHIRDDGALVREICQWKLENEDFSKETREQLVSALQREESNTESVNPEKDPPSFSTVPPSLLHIDEFPDKRTRDDLRQFADRHFPGFLNLKKLSVWLHPGEMLYLPCGWFHEVSSFSSAETDIATSAHVAVNYWFAPPNTDTFDAPYADNYWTDDWRRTAKCISLLQKGDVNLD